MKIIPLIFAGGALATRFRRDEEPQCVKDHEFEQLCENNDEPECNSSVICEWCEDSCNVNATQIEDCTFLYDSVFECIFELKKSSLAEYTGLNANETKIITDVISKIPESEDNGEARSGFFNMFNADQSFGQRQESVIPYEMMSLQGRMSAQFINCPVNVPFCQRQACTSSIGNPQQNALECYRIAGCCFDNNLFVYKSAFGGGFFPAPVCYRAIRTPIFHALAEQITMTSEFLPNFLIPIADKVDAFIGDENRFNLMLEYHQCLSGAKMAPSRLRLESFLTQVWPGYIWMRMRPQGDTFLEALVDTLSQTCGWDDITSRECMMIGCCWSGLKTRCTHPTDLTKIQPQKLIATATWMLTTMGTEETTTLPVTTTVATNNNAGPLPVGLPPGIPGTESRSGAAADVGSLDDLFAGLTGRRKRSTETQQIRRIRRQVNKNGGRGRERRQNQEARQGLSQISPIQTMQMLTGGGNADPMNVQSMLLANMMGNGGNSNNRNSLGNMMAMMGGGNGMTGNTNSNPMNNMMMANMMGNNANSNPMAAMMGGMMGNNGNGMAGNTNNNPMSNLMMANMMGNNANSNPMAAMMGNSGGGLSGLLASTMSGLGNVNNALFQQMGVSNINPFMNGQQAACPKTQAKLNCMAPPKETEKIDAMFMINTPKQCEVKGCCWDQSLMQQLLLARKSDSINNIQQFQCPWRAPTVGAKWGLPDLTDSLKGCCSISPCVHTELPAEWTLWGEWTQCTKLCGGGESIRSRSCIGNGFCPGMVDDTQREDIVTRQCNQIPCESWSLWAPWGQCSASCGSGTSQRFRSCTDIQGLDVAPPGISGGCRGNDKSSQPCKLRPCPEWGHWRQWSQCSSTCGVGQRQRRRQCNLPNQCPGPDAEMSSCGNACWATWNPWSGCSKSCFGGQHTRTRACLFQAETGMTCPGRTEDSGSCNDQFCEQWVNWQPWSDCTDGGNVCGDGSKIRVRECTGVPGAPGCQGDGVEQLKCSIGTCLWSEWAQASHCSQTCGEGLATYSRACSRAGQCPGVASKQLACTQAVCPGFQEWGEWSTCDVTCGSGRTVRMRECNGQINVDCRGSTDQQKACQMTSCAPQYGYQGNPYQNPSSNNYFNQIQQPTNTGTNLYGNQNSNTNSLYGNQQANTNSLYGNQQANTNSLYGNNNWGQQPTSSNTNAFNNLFGTTNQQSVNQPNSLNNIFGSSTTNNQGYYNSIQANPWAQVFKGFTG